MKILFRLLYLILTVSIVSNSLGQIPEATSGFQFPLNGNFSNNGGYEFLQLASYSGGNVYHPGEDWNQPGVSGGCGTGCNSDKCLDVVAAANGKVVYVNTSTWGGIVLEHNYQGQTWYSQYGHIFNAVVSLNQTVTKGQKIAEIGNVGTNCAHLHFEIRESDHPYPTNGAYWTYGSSGLGNSANVNNWYEDPDTFIPSHPAYSGSSVSCLYSVNNITLPNGWKFWKTPPTIAYNVGIIISNLPAGSHWALFIERADGTIIEPIAINQSGTTFNFTFAVSTTNPNYPNGGGYKFRLTPQGQQNTVWSKSPSFFISSLPTLSISIQPSNNLVIGNSATLTWVVSGGIPEEPNGGWTGNIRLQWYQGSNALINLAQIPVANGSYTFVVPASIPGGTVPGNDFRIAGVNAETGTSIPGGYVSAFTNFFNIVSVTGLHIESEEIPNKYDLQQNYPNPFNPSTKIRFSIPNHDKVKLTVFDITGKAILTLVDKELEAGVYTYDWDATHLSSGIYFYKLETTNFIKTNNMVLLK